MEYEQLLQDMRPVINIRLNKWSGLKTPREDLEAEAQLLLWQKMNILQNADNPIPIFSRMLEIFLLDLYKKEHKQGLWVQSGYAHNEGLISREILFLYDPWFDRQKEYYKQRYKKNREQIKERSKQWLAEHPDYRREYQRKYREKNRDKIREYQRKYREEHREHIRELARKYRETHKEEIQAKNGVKNTGTRKRSFFYGGERMAKIKIKTPEAFNTGDAYG